MSGLDYTDARRIGVALVLLTLIITGAGVQMAGELGSEMQESAEWCAEHDGDLSNVYSYAHGGLHCDLPNGTTVHLPARQEDSA